jgi:RimJ/RimL family protein N-acetyltransferase
MAAKANKDNPAMSIERAQERFGITLSELRLEEKKDWDYYRKLWKIYYSELFNKEPDFEETLKELDGETWHLAILSVATREKNRFHASAIQLGGVNIGFCDYVCFRDENGKCLIGNFYLFSEKRNRGYGSQALRLMEETLFSFGGKYVDLTPSEKAIPFYERHGYQKTEDRSLENGEIVWRKFLK